MTPKEKAKDLVDKYDFDHNEFDYSKEYALIAVDEIIESMDNVMLPNPFKQYWNKVKQEIQAI